MDDDKKQAIFEEKYQNLLNLSYQEWLEAGPQNEKAAYEWLKEIDRELNDSYEAWFNATGEIKEQMETKRGKLKAMYDLIEEMFGLGIFEVEK